MTNVFLKAIGASLTARADNKITSGMVGVPVNIEYDSAWDGLTKTVIFRVGNFARVRKNVRTATTVPWEVLRIPGGVLSVGIEGRNEDGDVVIPTIWATVSRILPGANGEIPAAPNPDNEDAGSGGGAVIDDSQTSANTTWSSQKISEEIGADYTAIVEGVDTLTVRQFDMDDAVSALINGGTVRCKVIGEASDLETNTFEQYDLVAAYVDDGYLVFARNNENVSVETIYLYRDGRVNAFSKMFSNVRTVNGISPDENGNVQIEVGSGQSSPTYTFRNLLNPNDENYEVGKYVNPSTGQTSNNANYHTSGYIEVTPGDRICLTVLGSNAYGNHFRIPTPIVWLAYYDENKVVVKGDGKNSGEKLYYFIPPNVKYVRVSIETAHMGNEPMVEKLTCVGISDEYLEYGQEKIVPGPAMDNQDGMFLPPYIYAVRGRPFDIYTAAMFGDTQNLNRIERIGVTSYGFGSFEMSNRRIRLNPTGSISGSFYFKVKNAEGVSVLSAATKCVVKTGSTATKNIVAIGDSLTNSKPWIAELMRLNPNYTFVGSQDGTAKDSTGTERTFKHDGRNGWRAEQYYTGYNPTGNAFWDSVNNKFSFSYYVANTLNGTAPDIVILFLGMNDMERNIDSAVNYEKLMVDNIRSSYPNMHIVVCAPQARDYNAEGHVAKNGFLMMKKLYEAFALYQNLYFVPLYLIHDSEYNYCLADEYEGVNLYSTITKNKVTDTVHPQNAGYFQFADAIYGALSEIR